MSEVTEIRDESCAISESDGGGQPSAGSLLSKPMEALAYATPDKASGDNEIQNKSETLTESDAKGSVGTDSFTYSTNPATKVHNSGVACYDMNRPSRGRAVIINNENFHWSTGMNKRTGTDIDAGNLADIFSRLGFSLIVKKDASCRDIMKVVRDVSREDHYGRDCFVMAILSHGDDGCIYGIDGIIKTDKIIDFFRGDTCPSLAGKPKIFVFQACRGTEHEEGVEPAGDVVDAVYAEQSAGGRTIYCDTGTMPTIPSASDFLFCYSVAQGFYSHRDTLYGSWYIQDFKEVMDQLIFSKAWASGGAEVDFLDVLTAVNKKVAARHVERSYSLQSIGKKQMPCFLSMLTKKLFLAPPQHNK